MSNAVWTIMKILNWTKQYFAEKGVEDPRSDAEVLLCAVLKCERLTLYVDFERPLTEEELALMRKYVQRRAQHEPINYILGEKAFMRNVFKVTPATLVPRPETELLVESLVKAAPFLQPEGEVKILDIGTGSGAIIVSLLDYLPQAKGVGVDISVDALMGAMSSAVCRWIRSLISSCLIRRIFLRLILRRWRRTCSRSRTERWTAAQMAWIFIAASVRRLRSIWQTTGFWRLRLVLTRARTCARCAWSTALSRLWCVRITPALTVWFLR